MLLTKVYSLVLLQSLQQEYPLHLMPRQRSQHRQLRSLSSGQSLRIEDQLSQVMLSIGMVVA